MEIFPSFTRSGAEPVFSSLEVVRAVAMLIDLATLNSRLIIVVRLIKVARQTMII